ncbi:MAG: TrpB-like pyridoxal phosphate-dependent enzyme [Candidatus Methanogaster sp.]|uniref:TrpB-like pyridoxal phosphate-dependent enzyme n=1 Tax=Candidatus Methanogaster sp. TaxID=3386292 RepID=A0AC61L0Z4_9EURY|nr:MAG: TrpB-like pyridoxal phosphate-dependent enzyme [ANME-2 cluster archaeon]
MDVTKITLDENELPKRWYNIAADLPTPLDPPLNPKTKEPITPDDLSAIFPMSLIKQEMSTDRWIDIPGEVRDIYTLWRPTPLYRAMRLEKALKTPAKIYYKWEGVSPPGSHKPNTAVAQTYYNAKAGIERITTETGAGQWGSALSFTTRLFDLECTVYMVRVSYDQKPYRRVMMETWGGKVFPSPSNKTECGRRFLAEMPDTTGSLGMAISEAVEDAATHDNANYALGSVLNHVMLHQSVIGLEMQKQFEIAEETPDIMFGCVGGGSNFAGVVFPYIGDTLQGKADGPRIVSCEPASCPTLTKGVYAYDFGDTGKMTPLLKMYTLGHDFVPAGIHAGGLRYHGNSPLLSKLTHEGYMDAVSCKQTDVFKSALLFARTEGFILAPETAHCVHSVVEEALRCRQTGEEKVLFFCGSGHGDFDLVAYDDYLNGRIVDPEEPTEAIKRSISKLPEV